MAPTDWGILLYSSSRWRKQASFEVGLRRMTIAASTTSRTMLFVISCLLFDNGIEYRVSLVDVTLTCLNNPDCFDCSRLLSL